MVTHCSSPDITHPVTIARHDGTITASYIVFGNLRYAVAGEHGATLDEVLRHRQGPARRRT